MIDSNENYKFDLRVKGLTGLFISGHSVLFKKWLCKIQMLRILFLNFPFHFFLFYSKHRCGVGMRILCFLE